ncbi:GNAT family N-acetyltransferase [Pleurocapsa sp. CCALA 161]|uniref:GNAT family N-acetyltransferase n=1 Tax=Pleurocapsa sp. CCALA 161 TaxID=2107688 RepID=UPI000D05CDC1|nr:GNAT family N-acetyltransferase [Pleurocapsa sp. CCALA 161]PSB07024.1 GNAT family N-acetyltransferase [Pleurocapsa sp. CCALA 161]
MKTEHFENIDCYRQTVEDYLLEHEAAHCLILGMCSQKDFKKQPYLIAVTQNELILSTAMRTPPHQLILSRSRSEEAIFEIISNLVANNISLPGVIAPKSEAIAFAQMWQSLTGQSYCLKLAQRIYQLETVKIINYAEGELRLATKSDRSLLIEWIRAFEIEAIGEVRTEQQYQDWYDLRLKNKSLYVWQNDIPLSMAGFSGSTPNGIRINAVYTPLEYRKQRYASSCVAALSQTLLDRGNNYCFLFTDLANSTSNRIYQKIGYQPACDFDSYKFEQN